jgi:hypothetical protein
LNKDAPDFRGTQKIGSIAAIPILGGLYHHQGFVFEQGQPKGRDAIPYPDIFYFYPKFSPKSLSRPEGC